MQNHSDSEHILQRRCNFIDYSKYSNFCVNGHYDYEHNFNDQYNFSDDYNHNHNDNNKDYYNDYDNNDDNNIKDYYNDNNSRYVMLF